MAERVLGAGREHDLIDQLGLDQGRQVVRRRAEQQQVCVNREPITAAAFSVRLAAGQPVDAGGDRGLQRGGTRDVGEPRART